MAKVTIIIEDAPTTIPGKTNVLFSVRSDPPPTPDADPVEDYTLAQFIGLHAQEFIQHMLVDAFDGVTQELPKG